MTVMTHEGSCLCGAVAFSTPGPLRDVAICHCKMCRRWHGHVGAYTDAPKVTLAFRESRGLAWYHASDIARRGYCRECGSSLFWEAFDRDTISITAGAFDDPTGLKTTLQIYVEDKGDYYEVDKAIPSRAKTVDRTARKPD
jgi:hypothetical protein